MKRETEFWSNHETQAVAETLDNESIYGEQWQSMARQHLAWVRRSWLRWVWYGSPRRAAFYRLLESFQQQFGRGTPLIAARMFRHLLAERMRRVDWTQIIDRYLDQVELEEEARGRKKSNG